MKFYALSFFLLSLSLSLKAETNFALPHAEVKISTVEIKKIFEDLAKSMPQGSVVLNDNASSPYFSLNLSKLKFPVSRQYFSKDVLNIEFTNPKYVFNATATILGSSILGAYNIETNLTQCKKFISVEEYGPCHEFHMVKLPGGGIAFDYLSNYNQDLEEGLNAFRFSADYKNGKIVWDIWSTSMDDEKYDCIRCTSESGCIIPPTCSM